MRILKLTATHVLALAFAFTAPAAEAEDWEYDLYLYGLGAGLEGSAGIGPVDADVNLGFSDILENLELGAMGSLRARKGDWAVMTDVVFVGLGAAGERASIDVDELILEVDLAYRFSEVFELLFGARYVDLDADLALRGPLGLRASAGESWVDPVVGLRFEAPVGGKWTVLGRLDAGGFGVGSDFSLQAALHAAYRLGDSASLTLGWRYLDIDYEDGEGRDRFKYDVVTTGPQVGVAFHF